MKKALIIGVTGQDGAYLVEFLLKKNYEVHGIKRRASSFNTMRIDHLYDKGLILHYGDLSDPLALTRTIQEVKPDEIYNLGAMSHVKVSFEIPEYTANVDGIGCLRVLEALKLLGLGDKTKYYQASTSELYGLVQETPQSETTPFYPRSPYAIAKQFAYWTTINYRESYGFFACNGILFNHESPLRGETFVTRKITMAAVKIALGKQNELLLGNLDAKRDWGHAKDYVEAMWLMLQQPIPEDFVIATGKCFSVRDFLVLAFEELGIEIEFNGAEINEVGLVKNCTNELYYLPKGKIIIKVDEKYFRPSEVDLLLGNATKAKNKLGWIPKYTLKSMVSEMIQCDLRNSEYENK